MGKKRARNLTDQDIELIASMIGAWTGEPTWEDLLSRVYEELEESYTRQALYKHEKIRKALSVKREIEVRARRGSGKKSSHEDDGKLAILEGENERLRSENDQLIEQFVRWSYNAHTRGVGRDVLDQPLPRVVPAKRRG